MSEQYDIALEHMTIRGKFWGNDQGQPTIALHGYLDNANSFDMIAPHLSGLHIYAMDFAGHGLSDYRAPGELYSGLNDIRDILCVADKLGWETFNIIGHSMGAEIGSQLAGFFPERVNSLICVDGFCGTNVASETLGHLRSTIASSFKKNSSLKVFPTFEAMTQRLCEATGQDKTSALCLIERGHKQVEGGFTWCTDPRIKGSGPLELTPDQLAALAENITADTLFIVADRDNSWLARTLEVIEARQDANIKIVDLPGHHHIHMQERSGEVVELINEYMHGRLKKTA